MKRTVEIILAMGILASFMGCGNNSSEGMDVEVASIETMETKASETEVQDVVTKEISVSTSAEGNEYTYIEQTDIFMVDHIDSGDGTQIDWDSMEKVLNRYSLPESVDIYSYFGTYAGYTKPDIEVTESARNSEWVAVGFKEYGFLVKTEDFERVAVVKENEIEETVSVPIADAPFAEDKSTSAKAEEKPVAKQPVVETPVVAESTKYTPEEAVAVYRSIMEENGITWNPSLKDGGSWGTGWIYLEKGQPEWAASTDVESYKMGDSVGNSWDSYYLEVTGSDENAVYVTGWHN